MLKNPELFRNVETGLRSMGTIKAVEDEHGGEYSDAQYIQV